MGRTTIQVSDELADELHSRKERGDSYEDVIWRLIEKQPSSEHDTPPAESDTPSVTAQGDQKSETERKAEIYEDLADEREIEDDVSEFVEDVAATWDDTEERLRARKAAAKAVLQHALDTGDAVGKSSEIFEDVRERYPVANQKPETYWRKNIRPVLQEAGEYNQAHHGYVVESLSEE